MTEAASRAGATTSDDIVVCTVSTRSHLHRARVLARSFYEHHPTGRVFVLLVDRYGAGAAEEPFEVLEIEAIASEMHGGDPFRLYPFLFRYTAFEACMAVKPYLLTYLFDARGYDKLLYLDSDMEIYDRLDDAWGLLDEHRLLITPHLTEPMDARSATDGRTPDERTFLTSGTFNMGFVGAHRSTLDDFLPWWRRRLYRHCVNDVDDGLFVDQKWMNLAPTLFPGVHVLRDPAYNIAYWNLHERGDELGYDAAQRRLSLGGRPAKLFHFSGFDSERPERISIHQDRYSLRDYPRLGEVLFGYRDRLVEHGRDAARAHRYAFGSFDNGVSIPALARKMYRDMDEDGERYGNPFETAGTGSFFDHLREHVAGPHEGPAVSRLWLEAHRHRPDLQAAFPDPTGRDREAFLEWIRTFGHGELGVEGPLKVAWTDGERARPGLRRVLTVAGAATRTAAERPRELLSLIKNGTVERFRRSATPRAPTRDDLPSLPPRDRRLHEALPRGINLVGHFQSEKGLGEAVRSTLQAIETAGIPHVAVDFPDRSAAVNRVPLPASSSNVHPYRINVVHIPAAAVPDFVRREGIAPLQNRYNVGQWVWELSDFPDDFHRAFHFFDEIWVPSELVRRSVADAAPVPVHVVPHSVAPSGAPPSDRKVLGIPPEAFLFLFMFDFCSVVERKNPFGLLDAFEDAFPDQMDVWLMLRGTHPSCDPDAFRALRSRCRGRPNVVLSTDVWTREEVQGLMATCDAYVSLHRSEGFGLTIAEAMTAGKPTIATGYGGNTDFMTPENGFVVDYRLTRLKRDHGPYPRGSRWARPDHDDAVDKLRYVYEHRDDAIRVGERARADVVRSLAPSAVGERILKRFGAITGTNE